ncbi:MAG: diguanylate cyclase/phosphodiesterase [Solirubrobacterales bacterium]|nr:diguanylate cyclase/phosphodiesterase [Solirubrobacterales bacterium]
MIASVGPSVMPLTAGLGRGTRRAVGGAGALLTAAVAALALHDSGLLGGGGLDAFFNDWVYSFAEFLVAGLVLARALLVETERRAWLVLAIGIAFYAAGDLYYTLVLENSASIPSPAPSDALYLLFYPCAYAMLARLVGQHVRDVHASVWLDGAIGGLTLAALGAALVLDPVIATTHGTFGSVATNLAYPLGDLVLIVFVFGVFALTGWRPGRAWTLILLGFSVTAVADSIYLFRVAEGAYRPGTALDALWPFGLALLAFAAWSPPRRREDDRVADVAVMLLPCIFGAVALFLLIRANYIHLGVIPEILAGLALLVGWLRFAATFNEVRKLSGIRDRQARTDDLTGLANRRQFYAHLNGAIEGCRARGASFALLMIDLDHFKELNDTLGHHSGDLLLQQIGPRMQSVVRGDAVARLGGDEFGLILRDASAAAATAERIHQALARPFELGEETVSVQASVGIAVFPDDAQSADAMLQRADVAMYQAKTDRSRYAFYAPGADTGSRERLGLVAELRSAIEQGGLVVHYQPQVDLRTNTVSGVEALVRWQHPRRGLLGPHQFVPVAEHTGVMRELTSSVLEQALAQQRAWLDEGRELSLAVNVSATNLLDPAFLGDLRRRLDHWRTPPGMLRLEITESVLITEGSRVRHVIDSLGGLGVNLSLDDFGTGYSPLSYLRELPVTEIKIDRSFVEAMMSDRDTATIVAAVIGLARRLGIEVVAEGIETAGQLEMLRSFNCPFAQGYLLSRPLPAPVVGRWLREDALSHIAEEVLAADPVGSARAALESRGGQATAGALVWPGPVAGEGERVR